MWNKPTKKMLEKLPKSNEIDGVTIEEIKIHMHFFVDSCDWYIASSDKTGDDYILFGFACLGDKELAEWGTVYLSELIEPKVKFLEVDREIHFKPTRAKEIPLIKECGM